jgi:hypothetical protein
MGTLKRTMQPMSSFCVSVFAEKPDLLVLEDWDELDD